MAFNSFSKSPIFKYEKPYIIPDSQGQSEGEPESWMIVSQIVSLILWQVIPIVPLALISQLVLTLYVKQKYE